MPSEGPFLPVKAPAVCAGILLPVKARALPAGVLPVKAAILSAGILPMKALAHLFCGFVGCHIYAVPTPPVLFVDSFRVE